MYAGLLDELGLSGVTVVGNSIGGWIAAEIALLGSPRVSGVVLVDAAGLVLPDYPAPDFFSLTMDQVAELSYYRPDAFRLDVDHMPDAVKAMMAGNRAALTVYGGPAMADPGLLDRLPDITVPVLVIWGEADRMIPVEHGRAYAKAIPRRPVPAHHRGRAPTPARGAGPAARGDPGLRRGHGRQLSRPWKSAAAQPESPPVIRARAVNQGPAGQGSSDPAAGRTASSDPAPGQDLNGEVA